MSNVHENTRVAVYERDGYKCQYCLATVRPFRSPSVPFAATVDHVVPQALGGRNVAENLVTACIHCNSSKRHTPMVDWTNATFGALAPVVQDRVLNALQAPVNRAWVRANIRKLKTAAKGHCGHCGRFLSKTGTCGPCGR